jgi:Tfp pilus assembly protein PilO
MQNSGLFQHPVEIVTTSTEVVDEAQVIRFIVKAEAVTPIRRRVRRPRRLAPRRQAGTASSASSSAPAVPPTGSIVAMARSFHELSSRSQTIIFVLLCGLTVVGSWQILIGPEQSQLASEQARLAAVQGEVALAQATASIAVTSVVQSNSSDIDPVVGSRLLDEADLVIDLCTPHAVASESAVNIASWTPKAIVTRPSSEWPISLGLESSYHDLGQFFDRIASMPRLMSVSDLQIKVQIEAERAARSPRPAWRRRSCSRRKSPTRRRSSRPRRRREGSNEGPGQARFARGALAGRRFRRRHRRRFRSALASAPRPCPPGRRRRARDPFVSLIVTKKTVANSPAMRVGTGVQNLAVSDVTLRGITKVGTRYGAARSAGQEVVHGERAGSSARRVRQEVDADGIVLVEQDAAGRGQSSGRRCEWQRRSSDEEHSFVVVVLRAGARRQSRDARRAGRARAVADSAGRTVGDRPGRADVAAAVAGDADRAAAVRAEIHWHPIDVDYQGANLRTVLRQLSDIGAVNIVIDRACP